MHKLVWQGHIVSAIAIVRVGKNSFTCRTSSRLQNQLCNTLWEIFPETEYFPIRKNCRIVELKRLETIQA